MAPGKSQSQAQSQSSSNGSKSATSTSSTSTTVSVGAIGPGDRGAGSRDRDRERDRERFEPGDRIFAKAAAASPTAYDVLDDNIDEVEGEKLRDTFRKASIDNDSN